MLVQHIVHFLRFGFSLMINSTIFFLFLKKKLSVLDNFYRNDPKYSDRQEWANSADPDQTAPRGAV